MNTFYFVLEKVLTNVELTVAFFVKSLQFNWMHINGMRSEDLDMTEERKMSDRHTMFDKRKKKRGNSDAIFCTLPFPVCLLYGR